VSEDCRPAARLSENLGNWVGSRVLFETGFNGHFGGLPARMALEQPLSGLFDNRVFG
jgi:hypothetical protein